MNSRIGLIIFSTLLSISGCKKGDSGTTSGTSETDGQQQTSAATSQISVDKATAGQISGAVKFSGQKPAPGKISMAADAFCKTQHPTSVLSEEVVVNPNGTLKNVLVYIKSGLGTTSFPAPSQPAVLDQKGCTYTPHVVKVQVGQELVIRNSDNVLHNVNARPKSNQGFNLGQPVKGMESKRKLDKQEVAIPVKCDVHPWMKSYIAVLSHPYGWVTGDDGNFSLKNLPPGTYQVEAWHEKYGTQIQNVTIGAKESKTVNFTFSNTGV